MLELTRTISILGIIIAISSQVNSFTKYGRGCQDIGCLPNEVCVMASDSCNFGQREGKECGTYPTCKRTGAAKPQAPTEQQRPTYSINSNADNVPQSGGAGQPQSGGSLYPSLPNQNPYGGSQYPGVNPGGYVPPGYNPAHGGQQPPNYYGGGGGSYPQPNNYNRGGGGGYNVPSQPSQPGYSGGGGYNRGGYDSDKKDQKGGFLSGILNNPHVNQAISGIIAGQITKAITGGNRRDEPQNPYGGGGYDNRGTTSSPTSNIIGSLIGGYLSGGGGGSNQNRGSSGGGSSGLGIIGDLLGGGGSRSSGSSGGGGGGGIGEFFNSKNLGGLFNENTTPRSYSGTYSGRKDYPTQPPYNYNG